MEGHAIALFTARNGSPEDMIGWLAATDSTFIQVIATDSEMELFTRAWCVAEVAEAYMTLSFILLNSRKVTGPVAAFGGSQFCTGPLMPSFDGRNGLINQMV